MPDYGGPGGFGGSGGNPGGFGGSGRPRPGGGNRPTGIGGMTPGPGPGG